MDVFLDNNSTTRVDPRVVRVMVHCSNEMWANASATEYQHGWEANRRVEDARRLVGEACGAASGSLIFTGSGTESLCTAIRGVVDRECPDRRKIVTCACEHPAVLECCRDSGDRVGIEVEIVSVSREGVCDPEAIRVALETEKACLVVVMGANNEVGSVQPIEEIGQIVAERRATFLCDVVQTIGKREVDVGRSKVDLAAMAAHKVYGPKGVGALYIRGGHPEIQLQPLIVGGGQERGLRGGTLNVPGIVGFGEACRIAKLEMEEDNKRIKRLRDKLEQTLLADLPDLWVNGDLENRLCNTTNIGFRGVDARTLIRDMHDIACSTKSACSSGDPRPSHVLKAIGLTDEEAYSCIRFSLGKFNTEEEIDYALEKITHSVRKLRRLGQRDE